MITKNELLQIELLNLDPWLNKVSDVQFKEYSATLNSFTDAFPKYEKGLKTALENMDYSDLKADLTKLSELLDDIRADELAKRFKKQVKTLETDENSDIQANITNLITMASTLSIDIQMAYEKDKGVQAQSALETNQTDVQLPEKKEQPKAGTAVETKSSAESKPAAETKSSAESKPAAETKPSDETKSTDESETAAETETGEAQPVEKTILAVDDAAFFLNMLKNYLRDSEYKITCVNSGKAALTFLRKNRPDLFILDIEMPGMDGFELAQEIRQQGHTAPILFLTGNADKSSVVKAIRSGGSDFIVKPISKDQVFARINKHIAI